VDIFRPTALRNFLEQEDAKALKGLSQNFLIDGNIIRKILHAAKITEKDTVIEIGPGPGALTEALLQKGAQVLAIELDRKFANLLNRLQTPDHRLTIFHEDALAIDLRKLFKDNKCIKLVSNLPYHLTTPLIERFIPLYQALESMTIMVQKEVAQRMTAAPKSKQVSSLSFYVRIFSNPTYCFDVPATCFFPKPAVTSAVVHLQLHPPPETIVPKLFEKLVRTAFSQRRKMLRVSLKELFPLEKLSLAFEKSSIPPTARPENLSMDQFIALYHYLFSS
jgi:16S rRNA (adenine1518-N6/adenine1519-N6)-dimethyltransferase